MTTPAIIFGLLIAPWLLGFVLSRLAGGETRSELWGCIGITLVFCFTGVGHFVQTESMAAMLPPWVPGRVPLVYVTGVIEIVAAVAVLIPQLRTMTGWALILMLLSFLPVNVYTAVNRVGMGGHQWGPAYLLIRVPLQALLIGWTWWFAVRPAGTKPIRFSCRATLDLRPEAIAQQILDLSKWPEFGGYGILPGIKAAEFEVRTPEVAGTRIRVANTDGSSHVEEIMEWQPDRRVRLHMNAFSRPLSHMAIGFDETWEFQRYDDRTGVVRSFEMHARFSLTRPLLWLIARLLKKAIARHLQQLHVAPQKSDA